MGTMQTRGCWGTRCRYSINWTYCFGSRRTCLGTCLGIQKHLPWNIFWIQFIYIYIMPSNHLGQFWVFPWKSSIFVRLQVMPDSVGQGLGSLGRYSHFPGTFHVGSEDRDEGMEEDGMKRQVFFRFFSLLGQGLGNVPTIGDFVSHHQNIHIYWILYPQ